MQIDPNLLTRPEERLAGMQTYIDGKMKRYTLLFSVNGGALAVAKLLTKPESSQVLGDLSIEKLACGAILFTLLITIDICLFGNMMRDRFFDGDLVFQWPGKLILLALSLGDCRKQTYRMAQDFRSPSRSGSGRIVELCARCRDAEGGRQDKPGGLFVDRDRLIIDERLVAGRSSELTQARNCCATWHARAGWAPNRHHCMDPEPSR